MTDLPAVGFQIHKMRTMGLMFAITSTFVVATANSDVRAENATGKIVGHGAVSCEKFLAELVSNPNAGLIYLAWAQGYMSAILLTRPPGVDEGLDINPPSFRIDKQMEFAIAECRAMPQRTFSDAVEALYKRLRFEKKV